MLHSLTYGNRYTVITHGQVKGSDAYHRLILKKVKNTFVIVDKSSFTSLETCLENTDQKKPVLLHINHEQTLFKTVEFSCKNYLEAAKSSYPSLETEAFYIQFTQSPKTSLISLVRKETVDNWLRIYKEHKIALIGFSIGNGPMTRLAAHTEENQLESANARLLFDEENNLLSANPLPMTKSKDYKLDGLVIPQTHLGGFAALLCFYSTRKTPHSNFEPTNALLLRNHLQNRIFYWGLRSALLFIFVLLSVHLGASSLLSKQIERMERELTSTQGYEQNTEALRLSIEQKKKLIETLTENSNSTVSYYLDQIGASVPKSVRLLKLAYQPLLKRSKPSEKIEVDKGSIFLSGTTHNGEHFTKWMRSLKAKKWIQSIAVIDYNKGKNKQTNFKIVLKLWP